VGRISGDQEMAEKDGLGTGMRERLKPLGIRTGLSGGGKHDARTIPAPTQG